jgi:hypothetical protein
MQQHLQPFCSSPVDIPLHLRQAYCQKQSLDGQLCDMKFLAAEKRINRILFIINQLKQADEVTYQSNRFYDCRNTQPFPELCDRTVALKNNAECYATCVVH